MIIENFLVEVQRMNALIKLKKTGTPTEFAKKLGLSTRTLHRRIDFLKDIGVPIAYDRFAQSYYYTKEGEMEAMILFKQK
jgi:predicted DNA-binding transcriptional regulator YafY